VLRIISVAADDGDSKGRSGDAARPADSSSTKTATESSRKMDATRHLQRTIAEKLKELEDLKAQQLLTEQEYDEKRRSLLDEL